jgi:cytoskeletal protein CcmA (bactofilin family)
MFEFGKKGGPDSPGDSPTTASESARHEAHTMSTSSPKPQATTGAGGRRDAAIIGPSIQIDGDLRGQEDLLVEGEVNGTIQLRNNSLTIGGQGKVMADVYAKEINVEGFVEGDLFSSERVLIRKSAQVRGNITAPRVSLEEGARFKGSIEMDSAAVEAALGKSQGTSAAAPRPAVAAAPKPSAPEPRDKPASPVSGGTVRSGAAS